MRQRYVHQFLVLLTVLAIAAGVAIASITPIAAAAPATLDDRAGARTSTARIYACVTRRYKTLNRTTKNAACPGGQTKISWHLRGARGVRGERGRTGARGPVGPAGAQGPIGLTGPAGSPDTAAQVLAKLRTVDGAGSGLDAATLGGVAITSLQRRVFGSCAGAQFVQSIDAAGDVTCDAPPALGLPLEFTNPAAGGTTSPLLSLTQHVNQTALNIDVDTGAGVGVRAHSDNGIGVHGSTESVSAAGVIGDNPRGEAVVGRSGMTSTNSAGIGAVVGRNDGPNGIGTRGFVTDPAGGIGALGQAGISGGTGVGVRGENVNSSNSGNGVEGITNGAGAGIYGSSTHASALAGHFNGNVVITGNLNVTGAKNFRIDHPLDPANKSLTHAAIETNELQVAYSGNVTTDSDGRATVTLPGYVDALAGDWRYQLTTIRSFSRVMVEQEFDNGRFVIRTEDPDVRVSWQLIGSRHDRAARHAPIDVEQDKPAGERGRYLDPAAFGKPRSLQAGVRAFDAKTTGAHSASVLAG